MIIDSIDPLNDPFYKVTRIRYIYLLKANGSGIINPVAQGTGEIGRSHARARAFGDIFARANQFSARG